jgi:hypothetical protein
MSRHTYQHGDDIWTVGYDRPLRSFYAQVEPCTDLLEHHATRAAFLQRHQPAGPHDPDELLLTVAGDTAGELPAVIDLTAVLAARNVPVPAAVRVHLEHDQPAVQTGPAPLTALSRTDAQQAAHRAARTRAHNTSPAAAATPLNRRR